MCDEKRINDFKVQLERFEEQVSKAEARRDQLIGQRNNGVSWPTFEGEEYLDEAIAYWDDSAKQWEKAVGESSGFYLTSTHA